MNHALWDSYRGKIRSKKGGWVIGKVIKSHGFDLMNDLVGKYSYMQVIALNATGKMPSRELADWLEAIHICLSWPDPRVWCNRIGALGGSAGASVIASTCAGTLAADSRSYGPKTLEAGVAFIQYAYSQIKNGLSVNELVDNEIKKHGGKPHIIGFSRPIVKGDERIPAMETVARKLGFSVGPHLQLAYDIEKILGEQFDEAMNINSYISGFMSDQGYNAIEVYRLFSVLVFSGVNACYVDTADREQGTFAPLHVADIIYSGKPARKL